MFITFNHRQPAHSNMYLRYFELRRREFSRMKLNSVELNSVELNSVELNSVVFKTRLKLARLSVTCFLRHPIRQSQFSLFQEIIGKCRYLQERAEAMRLTCYLTTSQHQVESSCSYRVVILASILVDCCLLL